MANPQAAPVVSGTDGLRKMRFSPATWSTGKSGALRICYVYFSEFSQVYLLTAYPKNEKSDLTAEDKVVIQALIREQRRLLSRGPRR